MTSAIRPVSGVIRSYLFAAGVPSMGAEVNQTRNTMLMSEAPNRIYLRYSLGTLPEVAGTRAATAVRVAAVLSQNVLLWNQGFGDIDRLLMTKAAERKGDATGGTRWAGRPAAYAQTNSHRPADSLLRFGCGASKCKP